MNKTNYAIVLLGLLHFFWMRRAAKINFAEPALHAGAISVLLNWRVCYAAVQHRP